MKYLLDTHSLIWFLAGDNQPSSRAREFIVDDSNELFLSIASLWEMAIKYNLGKLNLGQPFESMFPAQLKANSIEVLGITVDHVKSVCYLPLHHRDPFDRLIVAQSKVERFPIISIDSVLDAYGVHRVW